MGDLREKLFLGPANARAICNLDRHRSDREREFCHPSFPNLHKLEGARLLLWVARIFNAGFRGVLLDFQQMAVASQAGTAMDKCPKSQWTLDRKPGP